RRGQNCTSRVSAPSTSRLVPVMTLAAGLTRNVAARATCGQSGGPGAGRADPRTEKSVLAILQRGPQRGRSGFSIIGAGAVRIGLEGPTGVAAPYSGSNI